MAYTAFITRFWNHARDEAGIAGITSNNAVAPAHPLDNLIDDRNTTVMKFAAAAADHYLDFDLGVSGVHTTSDLLIPVGHSLNGIEMVLTAGNTTSTDSTIVGAFTPADDSQILKLFGGVTFQFWRLAFNTNGAHEIPAIWLTRNFSFVVGIDMPDALDSLVPSFTRFEQPSGITPTLNHGPQRRVMEMPFKHALEGTDLSVMRDWRSTVGMKHPFWITPPNFGDNPDPIAMKFNDGLPESRWGVAVPNTETEKQKFEVSMIESLD